MWAKKLTLKTIIEKFYKIKTKEGSLVTLKFNNAQNKFYDHIKNDFGKKPPRYIVLKARQLGISTFTEAIITALTTTHHHSGALIVAQDAMATQNIYSMTKRYIENLPEQLRPAMRYSNAKELVFNNEQGTGLDSSIKVLSSGNEEGSRSSTFRYIHLSEMAFWSDPKTAYTAIMQTLPDDNRTLLVIESTANGYDFFHELWQKAERGENDFTPLFFPWCDEPLYKRKYSGFVLTDYEKEMKERYDLSNDQLEWRRWCIANNCGGDEMVFRQEYPITPEEAFILTGDSYFCKENVLNRLKAIKEPIKRGEFIYRYDGLLD